jgi:hypothetical protein
MTYYTRSGSCFFITKKENLQISDRLETAVYILKYSQQNGFYLEKTNRFELPNKIYGNTSTYKDRIIKTFLDRADSTGVLLSGTKGSGKTLLVKVISEAGFDPKNQWPTIVISEPFTGEAFLSFMTSIDQPCVVIFDEFEKVYGSCYAEQVEEIGDKQNAVGGQESLLTLLAGVFPTKHLFLLTCNDEWKVSDNMKNRPGRLYYRISYKGLDGDFIRQYCNEKLIDKSKIQSVYVLSLMFEDFNFDMLQGLVEEMNRYGESADEVIKILNVKPVEETISASYDVELIANDGKKPTIAYYHKVYRSNPLLHEEIGINYETRDGESVVIFNRSHLIKVTKGSIIFKNEDGWTASFTKNQQRHTDYSKVLNEY